MEKVPDIFQTAIYGSPEYKQMHEKRMIYPVLIDVEPTNACNLDCIFCARRVMKRPIATMPMGMYKQIADEAATFSNTAIRFSGWGEPTLHKRIVDFIEYARDKDILVHLTTNATFITPELSRSILEAGLNKIKFSLQGLTEPECNRMRFSKGNRYGYKIIVKNIKEFIKIRNKMNIPCHVQVSVSMLKREQEDLHAQQAFYDFWYPMVDSIWGLGKVGVYGGKPLLTSFQRVKDTGRISPEDLAQGRPPKKSDIHRGKKCTELYNKISIGADGAIKACCDDADNKLVVSWMGEQTIKEVWDGEKLRKLRKDLESEDPERVPDFCKNCDNYF